MTTIRTHETTTFQSHFHARPAGDSRRAVLPSGRYANRNGQAGPGASATKHGLSASFRVLSNENQQEFDELIAEYHRTFAPADTHERFLVEEMAQSRWRLPHAPS